MGDRKRRYYDLTLDRWVYADELNVTSPAEPAQPEVLEDVPEVDHDAWRRREYPGRYPYRDTE